MKKSDIRTSNRKKLKNTFDDIDTYLPMGRFYISKPHLFWISASMTGISVMPV